MFIWSIGYRTFPRQTHSHTRTNTHGWAEPHLNLHGSHARTRQDRFCARVDVAPLRFSDAYALAKPSKYTDYTPVSAYAKFFCFFYLICSCGFVCTRAAGVRSWCVLYMCVRVCVYQRAVHRINITQSSCRVFLDTHTHTHTHRITYTTDQRSKPYIVYLLVQWWRWKDLTHSRTRAHSITCTSVPGALVHSRSSQM